MTNKKLGILFLVGPFASLVIILALYGVSGFIFSGMSNPVLSIMRVVFGFLGIIAVIGILVGLILGIKYLKKDKDTETQDLSQKEQYKNLAQDQINYINKFSWGAFFGSLVWALGNKLYLWALGFLVPFWNIYVWIKLSIDGRKMAWEQGKWTGFEQFKKRQLIMAWIIAILFVLEIISELTGSK